MAEPVKITVSDPDTDEVLGERILDNDYAVICAGNHYVDSITTHANGTSVVTIKIDRGDEDDA